MENLPIPIRFDLHIMMAEFERYAHEFDLSMIKVFDAIQKENHASHTTSDAGSIGDSASSPEQVARPQ